jgi:predicted Rossmann fold nucleotide-binding protein DprA/Smf involved in DNA uptake
MIIAVVGARTGRTKEEVVTILENVVKERDMIISGGAVGVDTFAAEFAKSHNISFVEYPPDPKIYPNQNPYFARNEEIVTEAGLILAFPSDSGGTWNTIGHAKRLGKRLIIFETVKQ